MKTNNDNNANGTGVNPAFIVEDTSSSISSFQSTSDQSSVAGSLVESPTKTESMEFSSIMHPTAATSVVSTALATTVLSAPTATVASPPPPSGTETITMTLEDISQFAQDIY